MTAPNLPIAPRNIAATTIIAAGCVIAMVGFGPRATMGFFQLPVIQANGWGRDVFGLAIAIQNLFWGIGQPFAGAIADRFGVTRVMICGLLLYAAGLALMTVSTTPAVFHLTSGVLIGFGLSGCSFNIVLAAFGKLLPPEKRPMALGLGTAAGSFGQFLFSPLAVGLIDQAGWQMALLVFAGLLLLTLPLTLMLATQPNTAGKTDEGPRRTLGQTLSQAFGHTSYILLVLGFFTCGFQLAFITIHLPAYLKDVGIDPKIGVWVLALIGLFNIIGSIGSGYVMTRMPRRYLLAGIYLLRSVAIIGLLLLPPSPLVVYAFGAAMGLLWLSTVPPTSSLVMTMFGTRDMAMLYGFAFFSHQVGGFLGGWLGGIFYEAFGNYDLVWYGSIALGVASALINLPIIEKAAPSREAAQPA
ncbi:MAG: MFS transporter [Beijerinckiaceae bacterium]